MTALAKALISPVTDPITDFTTPLYQLVVGNDRKQQVEKLFLTVFRTATFAGFFFLAVPFNHAFGHHDNLSASLAMGSQWIIHPYAAALFNAAISGGIVLLMRSVDMASKRQLTLTRADAGSFALAVGFLYAAQQIKKHAIEHTWLDKKFQQWSEKWASKICK